MAPPLTLALESSSCCSKSSSSSSDNNNEQHRLIREASPSGGGGRRERMFEKVVTPSDVGKLNRLVVPKHFAEKHLPLPGAAARAGGTVLCFHDARGAAFWRFRYSYWSSSQSYVMTKGWSRYVRDKRLAAGDTVSFCRDGAKLFIDCRRRKRALPPVLLVPSQAQQQQQMQQAFFPQRAAVQVMQVQKPPHSLTLSAAPPIVDDAMVAMEEQEARRGRCLRLFGVNLLELRAEPLLLDLQL